MQKCLSQNKCYFLVTFVLRFDLFALSPTNYQQTIFNVKALFCTSTRLFVYFGIRKVQFYIENKYKFHVSKTFDFLHAPSYPLFFATIMLEILR